MSDRHDRFVERAETALNAAAVIGATGDDGNERSARLMIDLGQAWATLAVAVSDDVEPEDEDWGRKDVATVDELPGAVPAVPVPTGYDTAGRTLDDEDADGMLPFTFADPDNPTPAELDALHPDIRRRWLSSRPVPEAVLPVYGLETDPNWAMTDRPSRGQQVVEQMKLGADEGRARRMSR